MDETLATIDSAIGGLSLPKDVAASFETACRDRIKAIKGNRREANAHIADLEKLLTVTSENLDAVKNQKWFVRVWRTVSGGNKHLEQVNSQNLLQVQKGALLFLAHMGEDVDFLTQSVAFALGRLNDLQLDNLKVRAFILILADRVSRKFGSIEKRLDQHDEAIGRLSKSDLI